MVKLSGEQVKKLDAWDNNHACKFEKKHGMKYAGAIGGRLTYSFTPTSLGCIVKVKCACGSEIDLTEYEEW